MSLLSPKDDREIRDAVKSVTDTFMRTDVNYHMSKEAFDEFEEDLDSEVFETVIFKALEEYPKALIQEEIQGNIDFDIISLTVNLEDLQELDLIGSNYRHLFNDELDYFTVKDRLYRVTDIYTDGPLSEKPVLLIIKGKLTTNKIDV